MKYIGLAFGGFAFGFLAYAFVLAPKDYWKGYGDGRDYGIKVGKREAVGVIQNEFGTYDEHKPYKSLFEVDTSDVISIETNGIKTVRVIP